MLTLGSSNRTRVDYSPRPELVKSQKRDVLPPPRVASASAWTRTGRNRPISAAPGCALRAPTAATAPFRSPS